jgi:hypothetical protein
MTRNTEQSFSLFEFLLSLRRNRPDTGTGTRRQERFSRRPIRGHLRERDSKSLLRDHSGLAYGVEVAVAASDVDGSVRADGWVRDTGL